jgi:hypothetical protein
MDMVCPQRCCYVLHKFTQYCIYQESKLVFRSYFGQKLNIADCIVVFEECLFALWYDRNTIKFQRQTYQGRQGAPNEVLWVRLRLPYETKVKLKQFPQDLIARDEWSRNLNSDRGRMPVYIRSSGWMHTSLYSGSSEEWCTFTFLYLPFLKRFQLVLFALVNFYSFLLRITVHHWST